MAWGLEEAPQSEVLGVLPPPLLPQSSQQQGERLHLQVALALAAHLCLWAWMASPFNQQLLLPCAGPLRARWVCAAEEAWTAMLSLRERMTHRRAMEASKKQEEPEQGPRAEAAGVLLLLLMMM